MDLPNKVYGLFGGGHRCKTVINVKVSIHKLFDILLAVTDGLSKAKGGDCGARTVSEQVDVHSVFNYVLFGVIVSKLQEPQKVPVFGIDMERVEHLFHIAHYSNIFLAETHKNSHQTVHLIGSSNEGFV